MRKHFSAKILMSFVLMFVFLLCSTTLVFTGKGPKIRLDKDKMDFGKVKQGKVLTHIFKLVNEGDETLTIDRVRTTCGCTAVLVSKKEIPPGKEGELKVTFNTRGYAGKLSKYIYVDSNDPTQKSKQITVSVVSKFLLNPRLLWTGIPRTWGCSWKMKRSGPRQRSKTSESWSSRSAAPIKMPPFMLTARRSLFRSRSGRAERRTLRSGCPRATERE